MAVNSRFRPSAWWRVEWCESYRARAFLEGIQWDAGL